MSDHPLPDPSASEPNWEALARHLAGAGSPDERAEMERQLASNPDRARLVSELGRAVHVPEPAAPTMAEVEAALQSVRQRFGDAPARSPVIALDTYRARRRMTAFRAAAAVLVVAGAGLLWRATTPSRTATPADVQHHFASAIGAIDSVTLRDGTRILLGPGTEVTLADNYGQSSREITLVGEARFEVKHDERHPFVVRTAAATFRDVGTVFAIHSDRTDGARIVVTDGSVAVQSLAGDSAVTLHKGDRASVAFNGALKVERSAIVSEDTAWTAGRLLFRDAPVAQVVADVRRWYGIDVRVDESLANHRVSAAFDRSSAADVGRVIAALLGGGFRQDGSTLYIVPLPTAPAPK